MVAQLDKLAKSVRNGSAAVQVIPFAAGAYAAADGYFVLLEFDEDTDLWPIVYIEGLAGNQYLERKADIARYRETIEYLYSRALDSHDSAELIVRMRDRYASELPTCPQLS
jgi:hypothetical protein